MDYSPPPLFKQGPSALARLVVFVLLAIGLLFTDAHFHTLKLARQVIGTALYPLQRVALVPRDVAIETLAFFDTGSSLRAKNAALETRNLQLGLAASRAAQLDRENEHLRALLKLTQESPIQPIPSEIQYETRDPFTRVVVIDHGLQAGIVAGAPVINEDGLIGQVTRVFPLQSEVTLLTDRDQAVPVQVVRTGVRSIIYGTANGDVLDLRFVPTGADIKAGDELVTNGLDGVYPSGLPVARVLRVDHPADSAFAKVVAVPIAQIRGVRQLLVLHYEEPLPPNPLDAAPASDATGKMPSRRSSSRAASSGASSGVKPNNQAVLATAASTSEVVAARRASSAERRRERAQAESHTAAAAAVRKPTPVAPQNQRQVVP